MVFSRAGIPLRNFLLDRNCSILGVLCTPISLYVHFFLTPLDLFHCLGTWIYLVFLPEHLVPNIDRCDEYSMHITYSVYYWGRYSTFAALDTSVAGVHTFYRFHINLHYSSLGRVLVPRWLQPLWSEWFPMTPTLLLLG